MNSEIRAALLFMSSFAGVLVLGYFAQRYPWWYEWGAKASIIAWVLIWITALICWAAPHIDNNKEQ